MVALNLQCLRVLLNFCVFIQFSNDLHQLIIANNNYSVSSFKLKYKIVNINSGQGIYFTDFKEPYASVFFYLTFVVF